MKKNTPESRLRQVMIQKGITTNELADAVALSPRSIHNIACENSKSRRARKRISIFLGETLWSDLPVNTIQLPEGYKFQCESAEQAQIDAAEFGDSVVVEGPAVTFVKPYDFIWIGKPHAATGSKRLTTAVEASKP